MQHLSTSVETCLKMDYFAIKSPKSPTAESSTLKPPFRFND